MTDAPKKVWVDFDISLTDVHHHYHPVAPIGVHPPNPTGNVKYMLFDEHERILKDLERDYQDLLQTFNALRSEHAVLLREQKND